MKVLLLCSRAGYEVLDLSFNFRKSDTTRKAKLQAVSTLRLSCLSPGCKNRKLKIDWVRLTDCSHRPAFSAAVSRSRTGLNACLKEPDASRWRDREWEERLIIK